jgi:hypothetical protein
MQSILRLFLVAALGVLGAPSLAAAQGGKPAADRKPAKPDVPAGYVQMMFFLAKGEPGACGPGCSEWIAAEGTFDRAAATRFRTFLGGLGKRKLPIFFHSPGGVGTSGTEIGRMLRARRMTAGVGRTIPSSCDAKLEREASCDALRRSGRQLTAELRTYNAGCNSACGFALLGAVDRQVAPDTVLGIHSPRLGGVWVNGFLLPSPKPQDDKPTPAQQKAVKARYVGYLAEMGIGRAYLDAVYAIPHDKAHQLTRNEIIRFGIDKRTLVESPWQIRDSQIQSVMKTAMQVEAGTDVVRSVRIDLACAPAGPLAVLLNRRIVDAQDVRDSVTLAAGTSWVKLTPAHGQKLTDGAKPSFDARIAYVAPDFLDQAARLETMILIETPAPNASAHWPRITTLSTIGLAALRGPVQSCVPPREPAAAAKTVSQ